MAEIRPWYLYRRKRSHRTQWLLRTSGIERRQMLYALGDSLRRDHPVTPTRLHGPLHARQRMHGQQLQYSNVMPGARQSAVLSFKMLPQLTERRWQAPIPVHLCVIQTPRLPAEQGQIMQGLQYLLPLAVAPLVPSNDLAIAHHLEAVHVGFDRDCLEGMSTGNAVAILLPGYRLVLVHLADLADSSLKGVLGQRQRLLPFVAKTRADGFALAGNLALAILLTTLAQKGVQLGQVFYLRNRRCPLALQELHPVLDVWLLVAPGRQAEQGLEVVVAGQRLPPLVQLPLPASQDRLGHRLGVVPPQFLGYGIEKRQGFHGAVQNRLGLLARQGDREGRIGVRPRHQQHRHLPAPLGKININMAKVRLGPLARIIRQRQEGLTTVSSLGSNVAADRVVTAEVLLLVA